TQYSGPFFHLLPYVEMENLWADSWNPGLNPAQYDAYHIIPSAGGNYPDNVVHSQHVPVYVCPSDVSYGQKPNDPINWGVLSTTSYSINFQCFGKAGSGGVVPPAPLPASANWDGNVNLNRSFTDGTSTTILLCERFAICGPGATPASSLWANG